MMMIAGVWILSMIVSLPPLIGWKRPQPVVDGFPLCVLSEEPGYVVYSTVGSFYVPLVVIVVVYSKIYVAARTRARRNLAASSQGQRSRRSQRRMVQSVSQSTTANSLCNQLQTVPSNFVQKVEEVAAEAAAVHGQVVCLMDPGRSWSETTASPSEADEVAAAPDFDVEHDEKALSDIESDWEDDEDTASRGPQVIFSTEVTVDVVDTASQQRHDQKSCSTGDSSCLPGNEEAPATARGLPASSALQAAAVMAERDRARRLLARSRERRATFVLGIVMASFIGCWLPFFSVYPLSLLLDFLVPAPVFAVIFWLGYCNSALNPIIYTTFNREFRAAFRRMLCPRRPTAAKPPTSRF